MNNMENVDNTMGDGAQEKDELFKLRCTVCVSKKKLYSIRRQGYLFWGITGNWVKETKGNDIWETSDKELAYHTSEFLEKKLIKKLTK